MFWAVDWMKVEMEQLHLTEDISDAEPPPFVSIKI